MRHFRVSTYSEEAELAPSRVAGVARDGKDEKTAPAEAIGSILAGNREGKTEILEQIGLRVLATFVYLRQPGVA